MEGTPMGTYFVPHETQRFPHGAQAWTKTSSEVNCIIPSSNAPFGTMPFTIFFATLLRPPNFTTRVLGAVKPSLSDDDDDEEEYDDDDDIDVTAGCLAAVQYILWWFCSWFLSPQSKTAKQRRRVQKKERRERISSSFSYSSMYIIDNT